MTRSKTPMKLDWFQALRQCRDIPRDSPRRVSVIAVAGVLMGYADADGSNCFPAIRTIRAEAGVSQLTVELVLAWLTDHGWLAVTRKVSRRSTVYKLIIPLGAVYHEGGTPDQVAVYHEGGTPGEAGVSLGVPMVYHGGGTYSVLRTPLKEEEEGGESASARSAVAPLAALSNDGRTESQGDGDVVDEAVIKLAAAIAAGADVSLDPGLKGLGREMVEAKARAGWDDDTLLRHCVQTLTRARRLDDPTAFLAHHLRTRVTATTQQPPAGAGAATKQAQPAKGKKATKRQPLSPEALAKRRLGIAHRDLIDLLLDAQGKAEAEGVEWERSPLAHYWYVRSGLQPVDAVAEHREANLWDLLRLDQKNYDVAEHVEMLTRACSNLELITETRACSNLGLITETNNERSAT
jgi:hypothetical protein